MRKWKARLVALGLAALALAAALFTLNRLGVVRVMRPPLEAQLAFAAGRVYPPPRARAKTPSFAGVPLGLPDQSKVIPTAAVRLLDLREDAERRTVACVLLGEMNLAPRTEREKLLGQLRERIAAGRDVLRQTLCVGPDAAAELLPVLGWPWTPGDLDNWAPTREYLAFSDRPEPIRGDAIETLTAMRLRLERSDRWLQDAEDLRQAGTSADQLAGLRVWSCRLALKQAFRSRKDFDRAHYLTQKFFSLTPFQADWFMGVWAAQQLVRQNRFGLPPLVALYQRQSETIVLVRAAVARMDLDRQVSDALTRLAAGTERDRAERELSALGPFALDRVADAHSRADAPTRQSLDRIRAAILAQWSDADVEGGQPARRYECWQRWLRQARPWL